MSAADYNEDIDAQKDNKEEEEKEAPGEALLEDGSQEAKQDASKVIGGKDMILSLRSDNYAKAIRVEGEEKVEVSQDEMENSSKEDMFEEGIEDKRNLVSGAYLDSEDDGIDL